MDFIESHLPLMERHSMRHYVRALELTLVGLEWKCVVGVQVMPWKMLLVSELRADLSFANEAERVAEFEKRGGGSRATYFNQLKKLKKAGVAA